MKSKLVLCTVSGDRLNVVEFGGGSDLVKDRSIAMNNIMWKKMLWESNAAHIINEQLVVREE